MSLRITTNVAAWVRRSRWTVTNRLSRHVLCLTATLISAAFAGSAHAGEDTLDRLLALLAARLDVGRDVAAAKWNSGAPIADPAREAQVLAGARDMAAASGADPEAVADLVSAQIEASKMLQKQLHAHWRNAGHGPFPDAPSLTADVRPKLDLIGEALPGALVAVQPMLPGHCAQLETRAGLMLADVDTAIRDRAIAPLRLWAGCARSAVSPRWSLAR